jgi:hypothetical protein
MPGFNTTPEITASRIPHLVIKLRDFLGSERITAALKKYRKALKHSGLIEGDSYVRRMHPWLDALLEFERADTNGKYSESIKRMAFDAQQIFDLESQMPKSIIKKFRSELLGDQAKHYLLEIIIAWHFVNRGYKVTWYEDSGSRHPEFKVIAPELEFDVECKSILLDSYKKIHRRNFAQLVDLLLPKIRNHNLYGNIEFLLSGPLPTHKPKLKEMCREVTEIIAQGKLSGIYITSFGQITIGFTESHNTPINLSSYSENFFSQLLPESIGLFHAKQYLGQPVDPIGIIFTSEVTDKLGERICEVLSEAAVEQLDAQRPAILICRIPEIEDFEGLKKDSGFQDIARKVFFGDKRNHIAAINYTSDPRWVSDAFGETTEQQTLTFRNLSCKFLAAKDFPFFNILPTALTQQK